MRLYQVDDGHGGTERPAQVASEQVAYVIYVLLPYRFVQPVPCFDGCGYLCDILTFSSQVGQVFVCRRTGTDSDQDEGDGQYAQGDDDSVDEPFDDVNSEPAFSHDYENRSIRSLRSLANNPPPSFACPDSSRRNGRG